MTDAKRWQHCIAHGFPVRKQNPDKVYDPVSKTMVPEPTWMAFGPDNVRAEGHSPTEAVDNAIIQTGG